MLKFKYITLPKLLGKQLCVEVYVALRDPQSYMLVQALLKLEQGYHINFKLYLVYESLPGLKIYPQMAQRWVLNDADVIAKRYGLTPIKAVPLESQLLTGQQLWQFSVRSVADAVELFDKVWQEKFDYICQTSTPAINFQVKNQQRLVSKGHYLSATTYFAGEWFVGVDRLVYLERRLRNLGLNKDDKQYFQHDNLTELSTDAPSQNQNIGGELEVFLSLRSPYSYLGFVKACRLAKKYQLTLCIKPIMPLMMRGLKMPESKQKYMYRDAYREAKTANIRFSSYAEPFEQGVINSYQIFAYALKQGKSVDYVEAIFHAIFVENINVSDERAIKSICDRLDINYEQALCYQKEFDWQVWTEKNFNELASIGLWGAPCFRFNETYCWGQDRLFLIEEAIKQASNYPDDNLLNVSM
ncbi:DsbA family protein [Thalassotalea sediminis]|uniref:DsbA family protein n=1 Tax=Thalassotalea sediminis TaxID=1759089 RepID=UPI002573A63D|nr:DsbA family protein [Thalassotalea sediminis]